MNLPSPAFSYRFCRIMDAIEHSPIMPALAVIGVVVLVIAGLNR